VDELTSSLFQIIMTLIILQKVFSFTHNDLHTNNIVWVHTTKKYIQYIYNNKTYVVPTFGRIYKIIDFGRSIYRYQDKRFCSDSYEKHGDAMGQYNLEFFKHNIKKPWIEPNNSFDLCRLGISMYHLTQQEEYTGIKPSFKMKKVYKLINEWCLDDQHKHLLFKNNKERYPGFLLYKMIAKTVHYHTPQKQLTNPLFTQYLVSSITIDNNNIFLTNESAKTITQQIKLNNAHTINIDAIPIYYW